MNITPGVQADGVRGTVRAMAVWMSRLTAIGVMVWHTVPAVNAQPADGPRFEVASIKLSKDPAPSGDVSITPDRFRGKDLAVQWLILTAWRINSKFLTGNLPKWKID